MGGFSAVCNFNVSRDNKITRSRVGSPNTSVGSVGSHQRLRGAPDNEVPSYYYTAFLSGTPSFDSYVIFSFLSTFTYTLTSHSAALKPKSLCSIWMAPECTCQLTVRAWNTYHESVTIQSIDSSTIPSFSRFY